MLRHVRLAQLGVALLAACPAAAEVPSGDFVADVTIDGKEAGSVRFSSRPVADGRVEEIRTDISLTFLGFEVFAFEQRLANRWRNGELQALEGWTNDDGEVFEVTLERNANGYHGRLNGRPVELPAGAYPTSPWRHGIVRQDLLFAFKDLELRPIEVARAGSETLTVDGVEVETQRFEVSGDWDATIWFDQEERLVRVRHDTRGHAVVIEPDRCMARAEVAEGPEAATAPARC